MKVDFDIVLDTYYKLRGNVRNKKSIFYFELLLYSNINYIVNNINNNTYKLSKYNIFYIKEKKYRLILSNNIYDKVYNHLVSNIILLKLDKYLIDSNVASRKNKGTYYGRELLHRYICKLKSNNKVFYILKNKYNLNLPLYKKNKGISIGSVCSQMLAVFYLNDLDHFIKEKLGCKYYVRYMDDELYSWIV